MSDTAQLWFPAVQLWCYRLEVRSEQRPVQQYVSEKIRRTGDILYHAHVRNIRCDYPGREKWGPCVFERYQDGELIGVFDAKTREPVDVA